MNDRAAFEAHPASLFQRHLCLRAQWAPSHAALHFQVTIDFHGALQRDAADAVLAMLVARHPALRTRFHRLPWGDVEQRVAGAGCVALQTAASAQEAAHAGFDIEHGPTVLARVLPAQVGKDGDRLFLLVHRIVADHASVALLAGEFIDGYAAAVDGAAPPLAGRARAPGYAEHAYWQRDRLASGGFSADLEYWQRKLAPPPAPLALPFEAAPATPGADAPHAHASVLDRGAATRIGELAQRVGASPAQLLCALFAALLYRYTGESALRIGARTDDARQAGWETAIGPFENVRVLCVQPRGALGFIELLRQVVRDEASAAPHSRLPFERLMEALNPDGARGQAMPFQVAFSYRAAPPHGAAQWLRAVHIAEDDALRAELALAAAAQADGTILLAWRHVASIAATTMARFARLFGIILEQVLATPHSRLDALRLLDPATLAQRSAPIPAPPCQPVPVHRLIAQQAAANRTRIAVMCGDDVMRFGELDAAANRLAHYLVERGLVPEARVGVALERGPALLVALLAVAKAGGAWVPLDPAHPQARIRHVLDDANVGWLLTQRALLPLLPQLPEHDGCRSICVDTLRLARYPDTEPAPRVWPEQLAYMIYTSGSSGNAKGVMVEHGPLSLHCQATAHLYEMTPQSRELHFLSIGFDGAHERWIVPLLAGGCVVLRPPALWSAAETHAAMRRYAVDNAGFPTSYLQQLAEWAQQHGNRQRLRLLSFGGEGMPRARFDLIDRALAPAWLINGYGPTEAVISPLAWKVRGGTTFSGMYAPIGRAVGARRAYVLDRDMNPLPTGVAGELYLGGACLARGYHGRPSATAERFVPDPFADDGSRLYRTGDRARWLEDGAIEYLGRLDQQIKLRGFRIEPGEIEAALAAFESVCAAAVTVRDTPQGPKLVGYLVAAPGSAPDAPALRAELATRLPDYMVPAVLVVLDALPLSPNGKVDRLSLPPPPPPQHAYEAPATSLERTLADIWQQVLQLPAVGAGDNFFDLGGDSLSALKVISRLRTLFPRRDITIVDLFNHPAVRQLAQALSADEADEAEPGEVIHLQHAGAGSKRAHLYCFPGLLVSTREYAGLARHLGPDQGVTGFVCHSLSAGQGEALQVAALAARYAAHIRAHNTGRPCVLLGWSWGGILAYETARLLAGAVDVRFVGMLDVCALDAEFARGGESALPPAQRTRLQRDIAQWQARTAMRAQWEKLFARMDAATYTQFLHYVNNSPDSLPLDGPDAGSREHIFHTLMDNALVFRDYALQPLDCRIHVWIAEDSVQRGMNVIDWRKHSPHVERVEVVAGATHLQIVHSGAFYRSFAASLAQ